MKNGIYWNKKVVLFYISIVCLLILTGAAPIQTMAKQNKTIRVGFPLQAGLTMKDEKGNLSGYTYDYLMEISQYTGWDYEIVFFEGDLNRQILEAMVQLERGEIDLLGAMNYNDPLTEKYAYPGYCYGINYCGLFVPEGSSLRIASLYNVDTIRVGVHNKAGTKNVRLEQYAQMNNIKMEQVITGSIMDYYQMIEDGRVDALLATDLTMAARNDMYAIAHFAPTPFYFATTHGNESLIQQLDYAFAMIEQVNPNFMVELYNKYFSKVATTIPLIEKEKQFIESCGTLEVVMYDNKPPFQSVDKKTGNPEGITVEVLDYIAKSMNLKLHYNTVSSYKEYLAFVKSGKADIAADALGNYQDARDLKSTLTLPWYSLPITMVYGENMDNSETDKVALPYFLKNVLPFTSNIIYYDTVEECLDSVQNGIADYSYIGEFCNQYFVSKGKYKDLKRVNQVDIPKQKLCYGIANANTDSTYLHTILNKGISMLPEKVVSEIVYRNTYQQGGNTIGTFVEKNQNLMLGICTALCIIVLGIWIYNKDRQQKKINFENKRYHTISNLANEYFYEYDVSKDELNLSKKCAQYFACEQSIPAFSQKMLKLTDEENKGIWQLGKYIINGKQGSCELSCEMSDHTRQWFEVLSSVIYNHKRQIFSVGKIRNIHHIKSEQQLLKQQASLDGLTGIYNICTFKEKLFPFLEQLEVHEPCALMIMDVDRFKQINDQFGHYNGDIVLTYFAKIISNIVENGLYGRLGGDEFVIFALGTNRKTIERQCEKICEQMLQGTETILGMPFSVSIGITWARKNKTYDELYKEADQALYQMKASTKNNYAFYEQ